jgi:hypothetical protein
MEPLPAHHQQLSPSFPKSENSTISHIAAHVRDMSHTGHILLPHLQFYWSLKPIHLLIRHHVLSIPLPRYVSIHPPVLSFSAIMSNYFRLLQNAAIGPIWYYTSTLGPSKSFSKVSFSKMTSEPITGSNISNGFQCTQNDILAPVCAPPHPRPCLIWACKLSNPLSFFLYSRHTGLSSACKARLGTLPEYSSSNFYSFIRCEMKGSIF